MSTLTCPECGCNDESKMMGFEVRGVYDGVLWWECGSCGWAFPRDFGPGRRSDLSRKYADERNAAGTAGETRR